MRQFHVLVIDDDPADRTLLRDIFEQRHPHVTLGTAQTGDEGLEATRQHRPDLIVLDLRLPTFEDGLAVLQTIKETPETRAIPVVVLSEWTLSAYLREAYSARANAFLAKPFHLEELRGTIDALCAFWFHTALLPVGAPIAGVEGAVD